METSKSDKKFPIVGIGASAGGLKAFTSLLKNLPNNTGMAFVLIQHLDPTHKSELITLLERQSRMPLSQAKDKETIKANHVYVIPHDAILAIRDGAFLLAPRERTLSGQMTIDYFFRSLAQTNGIHGIGVILSGTGTDGSLGVQEIKAHGGITFAQKEDEAEYAGMPQSAVKNGHVDFILSIKEIVRDLVQIGKNISGKKISQEVLFQKATDTAHLSALFAILKGYSGVDFTHYKHNTIKRRLQRRLVMNKILSLEEYVLYVKKNPAEINELYNDFLISVTNFFRDPEAFQYLKEKIFPHIIHEKSPGDPVRIWVPGCATGEEVYSLAISMLECLGNEVNKIPIQLFGTDISEEAIEKARIGRYIENIEIDVSAERLDKYFTKIDGYYQINKSIRDMCIFAKQDLVTNPPFSRLDFISCRNLLIYLEPVLQKQVLPVLHYALKMHGYLMLGTSESVGEFVDMFKIENKKYKIYSKRSTMIKPRFDIYGNLYTRTYSKKDLLLPSPEEEVSRGLSIQKEVDKVILQKYSPVGVITNENLDILQFRGKTSPFLEPSPGKASLNLLKMIRKGLLGDLSAAIHRGKMEGKPVKKEGIPLDYNGESIFVSLEVIPLKLEGNSEILFLILFSFVPQQLKEEEEIFLSENSNEKEQHNTQVKKLQQELTSTREYLQATIEELESSNEELQAANEEILSNNEELQSMNEELETSKEELQSSNEELTTVNEELQTRNIEVNQVNNDLNNLLDSVNIPIVILDKQLRIRRLTMAAEKVMNLIASDIGRPIGNIRPNIKVSKLEEILLEVIETGKEKELEIQDKYNRWYLLRLLPYKAREGKIDGAIMTLIDIDTVKAAEAVKTRLAAIVESSDDAIISKNMDGVITSWNNGAHRLFGYTAEEIIGKSIEILMPESKKNDFTKIMKQLKQGKRIPHYETQRVTKSGKIIDVAITVSPIKDSLGKTIGASKIARDISQQKRAEENMQFLSDAEKILSSTLDYKTTLINVTKLAVPHIADWCTVELKTETGQEQLAVAHSDPKKIKWAKDLREKYGSNQHTDSGVNRVFRTGKSELYANISDELLVSSARNKEELALLRKVGISSAMIVPLVVQRQVLGVITFIAAESNRQYTKTDLAMAEEVASRAALAIEHAQLFANEQRAVSVRDNFISIASHELKTPITSLKMYTHLLQKQYEKSGRHDGVKAFAKIEDQIVKLTVLINDLLDVSKIQYGKLEFTMEKFDLREVVKDTIDSIQETTRTHKIVLHGRLDTMVYGDRYRIYQVLTNFLTNAVKYSPQKDTVVVTLSSKKNHAVVSVQDFGIGVAEKDQQKIFNQFYRVTNIEEKTYPGLGMGLYIAYQIIKRHGGEMSVSSEKGQGATFSFTLPYTMNG